MAQQLIPSAQVLLMILAQGLLLAAGQQAAGSWLYATSWRPLAAAQEPQPQALRLTYAGPHSFPASASAPPAAHAQRRPLLLGLLTPTQQFTLPFKPSPFAGYSLDYADDASQPAEPPAQQLLLMLEPQFHAPGYPQQRQPGSKPVREDSQEASDNSEQAAREFVYMSPGQVYRLIHT